MRFFGCWLLRSKVFFKNLVVVIKEMPRSTTKSLQELHRIIQGTDDILNRRKFDTNWRVHQERLDAMKEFEARATHLSNLESN